MHSMPDRRKNHLSHILFCLIIQIRNQISLSRNLEELRDFLKSMQDNVPSAHDDKDKVPSDGGAKEVDSKVAMLDKDSFEVVISYAFPNVLFFRGETMAFPHKGEPFVPFLPFCARPFRPFVLFSPAKIKFHSPYFSVLFFSFLFLI